MSAELLSAMRFYLNQSIQETLEFFAELIVKILYLQVCLVKDKASWDEDPTSDPWFCSYISK